MSRALVSFSCAIAILAQSALWAAPATPPIQRTAGTTNPAASRIGRSNPAPAPAKNAPVVKGPGTAIAPTNAPSGTNTTVTTGDGGTWGKATQKLRELQKNPMFFSIAAVAVCVILGLVLVIRSMLARRKKGSGSATSLGASAAKGGGNVHSCNVLQVAEDGRYLWSFDARGRGFALSREHKGIIGEKLPQGIVSRDWRALFQKKLNVAWLPPEYVFVKVIDLPRSTFEETRSMVELQIEKLSPMPVTQVVWSLQVLPQTTGNFDTVIVLMVSRAIVEEFLGKLEGEGFLADRLELPLLDQLQVTPAGADGAYLYPGSVAGKNRALVAWWTGGVLKNLDLASLPATDRVSSLREQLTQMAWAGELEGWLTANPKWHLVAAGEVAGEWEPLVREALEQPVEVLPPLSAGEMAAGTAARAAKASPASNLLPEEFVARYHQQFVDRLWMRGLGAVVVLYLVGIVIYFIALSVASYRTRAVESHVASLGSQYTNAMQLKAQSRVLQDRMELKFAALDCWEAVSKHLPQDVVLDSMNFGDGERLTLIGSAPPDKATALIDFEVNLRKHTVNGQPLFDPLKGNNVSWQGTATIVWNLVLELKRTEAK